METVQVVTNKSVAAVPEPKLGGATPPRARWCPCRSVSAAGRDGVDKQVLELAKGPVEEAAAVQVDEAASVYSPFHVPA